MSATISTRLHARWLPAFLSGQPHEVIGDLDAPYLRRWHLIPPNRHLNVYLQKNASSGLLNGDWCFGDRVLVELAHRIARECCSGAGSVGVGPIVVVVERGGVCAVVQGGWCGDAEELGEAQWVGFAVVNFVEEAIDAELVGRVPQLSECCTDVAREYRRDSVGGPVIHQHMRIGRVRPPLAPVFEPGHEVLAREAIEHTRLIRDGDGACGQVHVIDSQSDDLARPHRVHAGQNHHQMFVGSEVASQQPGSVLGLQSDRRGGGDVLSAEVSCWVGEGDSLHFKGFEQRAHGTGGQTSFGSRELVDLFVDGLGCDLTQRVVGVRPGCKGLSEDPDVRPNRVILQGFSWSRAAAKEPVGPYVKFFGDLWTQIGELRVQPELERCLGAGRREPLIGEEVDDPLECLVGAVAGGACRAVP